VGDYPAPRGGRRCDFGGMMMFNILYHVFCETGFPVVAFLSLGIALGVLMLSEVEK